MIKIIILLVIMQAAGVAVAEDPKTRPIPIHEADVVSLQKLMAAGE